MGLTESSFFKIISLSQAIRTGEVADIRPFLRREAAEIDPEIAKEIQCAFANGQMDVLLELMKHPAVPQLSDAEVVGEAVSASQSRAASTPVFNVLSFCAHMAETSVEWRAALFMGQVRRLLRNLNTLAAAPELEPLQKDRLSDDIRAQLSEMAMGHIDALTTGVDKKAARKDVEAFINVSDENGVPLLVHLLKGLPVDYGSDRSNFSIRFLSILKANGVILGQNQAETVMDLEGNTVLHHLMKTDRPEILEAVFHLEKGNLYPQLIQENEMGYTPLAVGIAEHHNGNVWTVLGAMYKERIISPEGSPDALLSSRSRYFAHWVRSTGLLHIACKVGNLSACARLIGLKISINDRWKDLTPLETCLSLSDDRSNPNLKHVLKLILDVPNLRLSEWDAEYVSGLIARAEIAGNTEMASVVADTLGRRRHLLIDIVRGMLHKLKTKLEEKGLTRQDMYKHYSSSDWTVDETFMQKNRGFLSAICQEIQALTFWPMIKELDDLTRMGEGEASHAAAGSRDEINYLFQFGFELGSQIRNQVKTCFTTGFTKSRYLHDVISGEMSEDARNKAIGAGLQGAAPILSELIINAEGRFIATELRQEESAELAFENVFVKTFINEAYSVMYALSKGYRMAEESTALSDASEGVVKAIGLLNPYGNALEKLSSFSLELYKHFSDKDRITRVNRFMTIFGNRTPEKLVMILKRAAKCISKAHAPLINQIYGEKNMMLVFAQACVRKNVYFICENEMNTRTLVGSRRDESESESDTGAWIKSVASRLAQYASNAIQGTDIVEPPMVQKDFESIFLSSLLYSESEDSTDFSKGAVLTLKDDNLGETGNLNIEAYFQHAAIVSSDGNVFFNPDCGAKYLWRFGSAFQAKQKGLTGKSEVMAFLPSGMMKPDFTSEESRDEAILVRAKTRSHALWALVQRGQSLYGIGDASLNKAQKESVKSFSDTFVNEFFEQGYFLVKAFNNGVTAGSGIAVTVPGIPEGDTAVVSFLERLSRSLDGSSKLKSTTQGMLAAVQYFESKGIKEKWGRLDKFFMRYEFAELVEIVQGMSIHLGVKISDSLGRVSKDTSVGDAEGFTGPSLLGRVAAVRILEYIMRIDDQLYAEAESLLGTIARSIQNRIMGIHVPSPPKVWKELVDIFEEGLRSELVTYGTNQSGHGEVIRYKVPGKASLSNCYPASIFLQSGLQTPDGRTFKNKKGGLPIGYRRGTEEEALRLGMVSDGRSRAAAAAAAIPAPSLVRLTPSPLILTPPCSVQNLGDWLETADGPAIDKKSMLQAFREEINPDEAISRIAERLGVAPGLVSGVWQAYKIQLHSALLEDRVDVFDGMRPGLNPLWEMAFFESETRSFTSKSILDWAKIFDSRRIIGRMVEDGRFGVSGDDAYLFLKGQFVASLKGALAITDGVESAESIDVNGVLSGAWKLNPAVIEQLFDGDRIRSSYGSEDSGRAVAVVRHNSECFHFKENPKNIGLDLAVATSYIHILGGGVPISDFLKITYQDKTHLVMVTKTNEEDTCLSDLILDETSSRSDREFQEKFDTGNYARHVLMSLLLNSESTNLGNIIVRPATRDRDTKWELTPINHSAEFKVPIVKNQLKNSLFCMDVLLNEEFPLDICERLLRIDPLRMVSQWVHTLDSLEEKVHSIFSESAVEGADSPFSSDFETIIHVILHTLISLVRIQAIIKDRTDTLRIETIVSTMLGLSVDRYKMGDNIKDRLNSLYVETIPGPESSSSPRSADTSFSELLALFSRSLHPSKVSMFADFVRGKTFSWLLMELDLKFRGLILESLSIGTFPTDWQINFFEALADPKNADLKTLTLRNSPALSSERLQTILSNLPELEALTVTGCTSLKTIDLSRNPKLRVVDLTGNVNLETLNSIWIAEGLSKLVINNCPRLGIPGFLCHLAHSSVTGVVSMFSLPRLKYISMVNAGRGILHLGRAPHLERLKRMRESTEGIDLDPVSQEIASAALRKGDMKPFFGLPTTDDMAEVLKHTSFEDVCESAHLAFMKRLGTICTRRLHFIENSFLRPAELEGLLRTSPYLNVLTLSKCIQIDNLAFLSGLSYLEALVLDRLPFSRLPDFHKSLRYLGLFNVLNDVVNASSRLSDDSSWPTLFWGSSTGKKSPDVIAWTSEFSEDTSTELKRVMLPYLSEETYSSSGFFVRKGMGLSSKLEDIDTFENFRNGNPFFEFVFSMRTHGVLIGDEMTSNTSNSLTAAASSET